MAELPSGGTARFAAGGRRREEDQHGYDGELYALHLLREHQRRVLGRRLMGVVAEGMAAQDLRTMLVWGLARNPSTNPSAASLLGAGG